MVEGSDGHVFRTPERAKKMPIPCGELALFLLEYYRWTGGLIIDPRAPEQQSTLYFCGYLAKTFDMNYINIQSINVYLFLVGCSFDIKAQCIFCI